MLKNAPILILDEATSQLDSVTENEIQQSLWALMQGKTTIVIAHRLSTLLHMDRILVFDQGKIVEDGTHRDLLAKNSLYKALWDAQVGGLSLIHISFAVCQRGASILWKGNQRIQGCMFPSGIRQKVAEGQRDLL